MRHYCWTVRGFVGSPTYEGSREQKMRVQVKDARAAAGDWCHQMRIQSRRRHLTNRVSGMIFNIVGSDADTPTFCHML